MIFEQIRHITHQYLDKSNERTNLMLKNIIASFFIKGWSLVVQIFLVPVALNCLTTYEYGIWLTLSSILAWSDTFDVGLGNGMRNKLAEALANNDKELGRIYVSTTFIALFFISIVICVGANLLIFSCDLYELLNISKVIVPNLQLIASLLTTTVCLTFIAKGINSFYLALQLPAVTNLMQSLASTLALVGIGTLALLGVHSLLYVTLIFSITPLLVFVGFAYNAFFARYRDLKPSFAYFDKKHVYSLMSLSVKFFIGQMAGMILLLTANVVISNALSPEHVSSYQIAYKYYSFLLIPFTLITTPLWSASTNAYATGDMIWIKRSIKKMEYIVAVVACIIVIMYLLSGQMFHLWVGDKVVISNEVSAAMALYIFVYIWGMCYSSIIYGIGKVNLTVGTVSVLSMIFLFVALHVTSIYGLVGLISLQIMVGTICMLQTMIQCRLILKDNRHY